MTILHLERSHFFQKIVQEICLSKGFFYHGCSSIGEAFEILEAEHINLILTSKELEKESGDDFILELSTSKYKNIPVIVITSEDSLKSRERFFSLGVVDYILKKNLSAERFSAYLEDITRQDTLTAKLIKLNYAVLDDSNVSRQIIISTLKNQEIKNITGFSQPGDLLSRKDEFDVYFIDMVMPGMSGEEVIRALRKKNKKAIIITISSISNFKTISQILNVGANDYIPKPFDADIFLARLKANIRTFSLMKELEEKNRELERLSITDGLTGVFNHRHILQILTDEIEQRERKKGNLAIMLIDIDNFKHINDRYGHLVGDDVLVTLSRICLKTLSEDNFFGRYGGEEFLIVMPDKNQSEAIQISDTLRKAVSHTPFPGIDKNITFSGGIAEWDNEDNAGLIKKADNLLYKAKKEGRNRILS